MAQDDQVDQQPRVEDVQMGTEGDDEQEDEDDHVDTTESDDDLGGGTPARSSASAGSSRRSRKSHSVAPPLAPSREDGKIIIKL